MATSIYITILDEKDKKVRKFIRDFCKFHNKKRHPGKKGGAHKAKVVKVVNAGDDFPFIAIPTHYNEDNHTIKTMADIFAFLEESPEFNSIDIWGDKIEVEGHFV